MSEYLKVLVLSLSIPLAVSFWPGLKFYRNLPALIKAILLILVIFGCWDVLATYRQHWYFNSRAVYSLRVINLPLEEILFFAVIPFCCIFTWEALKALREKMR